MGLDNKTGRVKSVLKKLKFKNFAALTLSGTINAIGITIFLMPVNLFDSGISGTSLLVSQLTPEWLSLSLCLLILNVPLFLSGCKRQGAVFTVYSVYAVAIYSLMSFLITYVIPIDVLTNSPLAGSDLLLCAAFGGLISGVGSGLTIRFGGALDGIEVMSVIFAKKLSLTVGSFIMIYNVVLYVIAGSILGSWTLPLYSIIAYAVALKAIDFIVEGFDRSKSATIVTEKANEVGAAISEQFECGITMMPAKGFYSGNEKTVLYVVLNRFQIPKMKAVVREADPSAYISITEIADVFSARNKR